MALKKGTRLLLWITALGMIIMVAASVAVFLLLYDDTPSVAEGSWLELPLSGRLSDGPLPDSFVIDPEEVPLTLHDVTATLEAAAKDESVGGLYLRLDNPSLGMAGVQELRSALHTFRDAGKECVVWSKSYDNLAWYLASACDEIHVHPAGVVMVLGLSVSTEHYAEAFSKIGVEADYEKVGTFKSAVETYEEMAPSEATQRMYESLLDSLFSTWTTEAAADRGIETAALVAMIDDPPITAKDAVDRGMIDALTYRDELEDERIEADLEKFSGYARSLRRSWRSAEKVVAVVHMQGAIIDGDSSGGGFGGSVIGDASVVTLLNKLAEDDDVSAVVLRVNSPGGSALASDVMWRAIRQLDEKKPVVTSMAGVAASGGYYVAMGTRYIVAQPATLTGSIGVFAGKFAISDLMAKVGVNVWTSTRGELAQLLSSPRPFTEAERSKLREYIESSYETFVSKAAEGRGLSFEELDAVAQGRVWTGAQAVDIGLVDETGGLSLAVLRAAELADMPDPESVSRRVLPRRSTLLEVLTKSLEGGNVSSSAMVDEALAGDPELAESLQHAFQLRALMESGVPLAMDPVRVRVH